MSPVELTETTFEKTITEGAIRDQVAAEEAARSPEV